MHRWEALHAVEERRVLDETATHRRSTLLAAVDRAGVGNPRINCPQCQWATVQRPRPWLAAVFAAVFPGLGHVYLRSWLRAFTWLSFALAAALLVFPVQQALSTATLSDPSTIPAAFSSEATNLSTIGLSLLGLVVGCNVADAYTRAQRAALDRTHAAGEEAASCPECGRPLDGDLEFCHWCTTPLDAEE